MGLKDFFRGKTSAPSIEDLVEMNGADVEKLIKSARMPKKTAKDLRKAHQEIQRKTTGERGLGAIRAALKGSDGTGSRNYQNLPLKDRMHPAAYKALLQKEAKRQGLL